MNRLIFLLLFISCLSGCSLAEAFFESANGRTVDEHNYYQQVGSGD